MISSTDYAFFRTFLHARSGLALPDDKHYLLESRLTPIARSLGATSLGQLAERLKRPSDDGAKKAVVEAMTTNESLFFRDMQPFETLASTVLPALHAARPPGRNLRIWCAAASTGQEPYSIAMLLQEHAAKIPGRKVEIIATDISSEALARAKAGVYTQFEVQRGLPVQYLLRHFKKDGDNWKISNDIIRTVAFKEFNLLESPAALGIFDVVFCRNVLIYFDLATKIAVFGRLEGVLPKDGYLFLGGAETVVAITDKFKPSPAHRSLYVRS